MILDVQGFKVEGNKFILKELAGFNGDQLSHYIFKPPFPFKMLSPEIQRQAIWLTNHHHCIKWEDGFTQFHQIKRILQEMTASAENIYMKGKEKADYVSQLIEKPILLFEEQPALVKSSPKCFYHSKSECMCALSNVFYLYDNFVMS